MLRLLSEKEMNEALGYPPRPAPQAGGLVISAGICIAQAQAKMTLEQLLEYEECSTPDHIHLVIPRKMLEENDGKHK